MKQLLYLIIYAFLVCYSSGQVKRIVIITDEANKKEEGLALLKLQSRITDKKMSATVLPTWLPADFQLYKTFLFTNCKVETSFDTSKYFLTLVFKTKAGKLKYIIDSNCDNNMTNDKSQDFPKNDDENRSKIFIQTTCQIDSSLTGVNIIIKGNNNGNDIKLNFYTEKERKGILKEKTTGLDFYLTNWQKIDFYTKENSEIFIGKNRNSAYSSRRYHITDTFFWNKKYYRIERISKYGDSLIINELKDTLLFGHEIGFKAKELYAFDIMTNAPVQLNNSGFTILEFWGTWCVPCLALTEKIKTLANEISGHNVKMIGIANDTDSSKVVNYIIKKGIDWPNILQNRKSNISNTDSYKILTDYGITGYPTFILIDKRHKIVFKGGGEPGFEELKKMVKLLLVSSQMANE